MTSILKQRYSVEEQEQESWDESEENAHSPEIMTAEVDPLIMTGGVMSDREGSELPVDMAQWTDDEIAAYNALRSKRKKCCIGGCTHRSLPIAKSYHQLPVRNEEVWKKWVEIIRWSRNDVEWTPNGDAAPLVCSRHFEDSDFISYEASSRVRLSHTAIPVHYIDPPEGTKMDPRFSNPPPVPSISSINRQKDQGPKAKKVKMDEYFNNNGVEAGSSNGNGHGQMNSKKFKIDPAMFLHNGDNVGYDIEEVQDESYDDSYNQEEMEEEEQVQPVPLNLAHLRLLQRTIPGFSGSLSMKTSPPQSQSQMQGNRTNTNFLRHSAPNALVNNPRANGNGNQNRNGTRTPKLPALIKADNLMQANRLMIQRQSSSSKPLVVEGGLKSILNTEFQSSINRTNGNNGQKHKIGLPKCKLIIQTLENQMKIAEVRLAEQLNIPVQVVRGVWNMRDSLKEKL